MEKGNFLVFKVGGSVLANPQDMKKIARSFFELKEKMRDIHFVIVVSAIKGITNKLLEALDNFETLDVEHFLGELFEIHKQFVADDYHTLEILKREIYSIEKLLVGSKMIGKIPDFVRDRVLCSGERWSAVILRNYMEDLNFKIMYPENFILTDGKYGNSNVLLEKTKSIIESNFEEWEHGDFIVPGFYGKSDVDGNITILGRGGSDYTATVLGYSLDALGVVLVKDVPGFLTGDPKITGTVNTIRNLSYEEADELSYFGAKVLHHNAVEPLRIKGIPLYICAWNSLGSFEINLCEGCTVISNVSDHIESSEAKIKSVSMTDDIAIVQFKGHNLGRVPGILGEIASQVSHAGLNIKFVITSQTSIVLIVSKNDLENVLKIAEKLKIKEIEDIKFSSNKTLIAVVGEGLLNYHGIASRIFQAVASGKINVEMISAGASDVSVYFIVDEKDGQRALKLVHDEFFN